MTVKAVKVGPVERMVLSSKIVEIKEEGEVVERRMMTTVKFEFEGSPRTMAPILSALAENYQLAAVFGPPESIVPMEEEAREPVGAAT